MSGSTVGSLLGDRGIVTVIHNGSNERHHFDAGITLAELVRKAREAGLSLQKEDAVRVTRADGSVVPAQPDYVTQAGDTFSITPSKQSNG